MSPMQIHTLETPELGDRTYVVDDGTVSVVIDPQRDLDRLEPVLEHSPSYVLETHIHNDWSRAGSSSAAEPAPSTASTRPTTSSSTGCGSWVGSSCAPGTSRSRWSRPLATPRPT